MDNDSEISMNEASKMLNVSSFMIRKFCNSGLVPGFKYRVAGRRVFTPEQVDWLRTIIKLRATGMDIGDLKKYVALCREGDSTIAERKAMLETQKRQLWQELEDIQAGIDFIERKNEVFDEVLRGEGKLPDGWF